MRKHVTTAIIAGSVIQSATAVAATTSATMDISAEAIAACTVSATSIAFGQVDGTSVTPAQGLVEVTCSANQPYVIALDAGLHYDVNQASRYVQSPNGNVIAYGLFDQVSNFPWGDANWGNTNLDPAVEYPVGTGAPQQFPVDAILSADGSSGSVYVPGEIYTDTVTVTVHY